MHIISKYIDYAPPSRYHICLWRNQDDIYDFREVQHYDKCHKHHNERNDHHES